MNKLVVDCSTGTATVKPLTPAEDSRYQADQSAVAASAADQATKTGNRDTLQTRAQSALAANATFLAITAPTAAEVRTQTIALTKECSALIRLLLNQLDSTAGT